MRWITCCDFHLQLRMKKKLWCVFHRITDEFNFEVNIRTMCGNKLCFCFCFCEKKSCIYAGWKKSWKSALKDVQFSIWSPIYLYTFDPCCESWMRVYHLNISLSGYWETINLFIFIFFHARFFLFPWIWMQTSTINDVYMLKVKEGKSLESFVFCCFS